MSGRAGYVGRVLRLAVAHPLEVVDRLEQRIELARWPIAPDPLECIADDDALATLHDHLGAPWPCADLARYRAVYAEMEATLGVGSGHDSDSNLGLVMACCVRHLGAQRVVEAGVARGVSTRLALEAVRDNGRGRLWSIDLPYQLAAYQGQVALAVPAELRPAWQLHRGSSQRRLAPLLIEVGPIQVFMRDTLPTPPTVLRELRTAWPHLEPGGVVIAQDVHKSSGFDQFVSIVNPARVLKVPHHARPGVLGIAWK